MQRSGIKETMNFRMNAGTVLKQEAILNDCFTVFILLSLQSPSPPTLHFSFWPYTAAFCDAFSALSL